MRHHIRAMLFSLEESVLNEAGELFEGLGAFVAELRERGVKTAVYGSGERAEAAIVKLKLDELFDVCHTSGDAVSPGVLIACADELGVPAFHCLVVDSGAGGVEAALGATMKVIGIGPSEALVHVPETAQSYGDIDVDFLLESGRTSRFEEEPWNVSESRVRPRRARYWETVFALSNGYMGLRGTHEEEDEALEGYSYPGMFINGVYGYKPYQHPISFPGFAHRLHAVLNLADWRIFNLTVDGERFSFGSGTVSEYRRTLDMRRGIVERSLVWCSPKGRRVRIRSMRVVSMVRRHCAAVRYEVTPVDSECTIEVESKVRTTSVSGELGSGQMRLVDASPKHNGGLSARVETTTGPFAIGMAFSHRFNGDNLEEGEWVQLGDDVFARTITAAAKPGETVGVEKCAAFYSSIEAAEEKLVSLAADDADRAAADGFDNLVAEQEEFWARHWEIGDIEIEGSPADQQVLRFNLFHLWQSHPEDDNRSISANAITGDKYKGHVFWDTEMYLVPPFLYTRPELVRPLLMYRHSILDKARRRAAEMAGRGALYSWNSISGEECAVVFEASTAQYHLLCAIAFAVWRYVRNSGDTEFLYRYGAEVLVETARFLYDLGAFIPARGNKFCINTVCGPDEYGCGVNNNCYTNTMAQWHLRYAAEVLDRMAAESPALFERLSTSVALAEEEPHEWRRAAEAMFIPYNRELGIHEQNDAFLYLDPVDMSRVPRNTDIRETTHPLNLWRMQVLKQADVVLLMFVQGHQYSAEQKQANYEFYEPRTTHGSSLSACIHAIVAAELGQCEEAYAYFRESAMMDLHDFKDNTGGGIHAAALGGTWMAVVNGFGGMRDYPEGLRFTPRLPEAWSRLRFKVMYRGSRIEVDIGRDTTRFRLVEGPAVRFFVGDQEVRLTDECRVGWMVDGGW